MMYSNLRENDLTDAFIDVIYNFDLIIIGGNHGESLVTYFTEEGIALQSKCSFMSLFIHVSSDQSMWDDLISRSHLMSLRLIWAIFL